MKSSSLSPKDQMQMHVIFGRPRAGKTGRLIEEMNACGSSALLFSLENPEFLLRQRGLREMVPVVRELDLECLGAQVRPTVKVVGLENLELLDQAISLPDLCSRLQSAGVDRFITTCHLRRDLRPASEKRLIGVSYTSETL